jgi:hypothetical protein
MLLGAVALLGLIGLLHQDCPGSSPSGLGDGLSLPPRGTQTRLAPESARRVVVRRMIGRVLEGCQTSWIGLAPGHRTATRAGVPSPSIGHTPIPPGSIAESPCGARSGGAILSGPSAPETHAGRPPKPGKEPRETCNRSH